MRQSTYQPAQSFNTTLYDWVRGTGFLGLPTECHHGYVFFPWGTGPTFPVFCDSLSEFTLPPVQVGSQFLSSRGTAAAEAVAELAGTNTEEAASALAGAAGLAPGDLAKVSVRELAERIVQRSLRIAEVRRISPAEGVTLADYLETLGGELDGFDAPAALRSLGAQVRLADAGDLPLADLGQHLDPAQPPPGAVGIARTTGTTVCAYGAGRLQCGRIDGVAEGILWGGVIGGVIGGGLGAAIGALIGGLWAWLGGDD